MDFGFNLPTRGPLATPETIVAMAERGEELGFAYFAFPDHIVVPRKIDSRYPYSDSGEFPGSDTGESLEQLTLMGYVAAVTKSAKLLTSVMVVPHRNPVFTAKALATIDVLSKGRVVVGCGAGWMKEEFDALDVEPFAERGKVTDEYLAIFKELWQNPDPSFSGDYAKFDNITFLPRPVQQPNPPLWIGGESGPALRRAARLGDAWYPIGANPRHPLNTVARYGAALEKFKALVREYGRDEKDVDLAFWANYYNDNVDRKIDGGERHILTGNAGDIIDDVKGLGDHGVRHVLFNFQRENLSKSLDSMSRFADSIMAKI